MRDRPGRGAPGGLLVGVLVGVGLAAACTGPSPTERPPVAEGRPGAPPPEGTGPAPGADSSAEFYAQLIGYDPRGVTAAPAATAPGELIGGAPDPSRAAQVRQMMRSRGHDLTGLDVRVFPIGGGASSLLVLSVRETAPIAKQDQDELSDRFGQDLVTAIRHKAVDVDQVALNFAGRDSRGPYVVTATFAAADAKRIFSGDGGEAVKVQVTRGRSR